MRQTPLIFAGAIAVGLFGGFALRGPSPTTQAVEQADNWKPRNTIQRETLMSADDLDRQQPSAAVSGTVRRPVQQAVSTWSYRNCAAARAAGATPIYRGQPGYGAHMDGDGDGIACEPYRR